MRLLLTGATGFVGKQLRTALAQAGHEVHCVSRSSATEPNWHTADLSDAKQASELVAAVNPEQILHFASAVTGSRDLDAVQDTLTNNLISTVNLLCAAHTADTKRVIFAGSMEEARLEGGATRTGSPYAASKTAAGLYGSLFSDLYDVEFTHLRLFMIYGPDQPDRRKFVPYVIDECLANRTPQLSSGTRPIDWIYIEDVVSAVLAAVNAQTAVAEPIDIGAGELHTLSDVAKKITELVPGKHSLNFSSDLDRKLEQVSSADMTLAARYLDWSPKVSLQEGLARTIEWHQANPTEQT